MIKSVRYTLRRTLPSKVPGEKSFDYEILEAEATQQDGVAPVSADELFKEAGQAVLNNTTEARVKRALKEGK